MYNQDKFFANWVSRDIKLLILKETISKNDSLFTKMEILILTFGNGTLVNKNNETTIFKSLVNYIEEG